VCKVVCKHGYANGAETRTALRTAYIGSLLKHGQLADLAAAMAACKAGALPAELPPQSTAPAKFNGS
jgi:hypothetical protein